MSTARVCDKEEARWNLVAPNDEREQSRIHAVNRILLYARGLELDAEAGLKLASESLRRSGGAADMPTVLAHMHEILSERGIGHTLTDADGIRLVSSPPIRRTAMTADCPVPRSLTGWIRHGAVRVWRLAFFRKAPCAKQSPTRP